MACWPPIADVALGPWAWIRYRCALRWLWAGLAGMSLAGGLGAQPATAPRAGAPVEVRICDDEAEWPPYTYWVRKDGVKTREVTGYTVELIRRVLERQAVRHRLELVPWNRCEEGVRAGQPYHMLLNASRNPQRERDFWISSPLYSTRTFYFWSWRHHRQGLDIQQPADLKRYVVGGVLGYAYSQLQEAEPQRFVRASNYANLVQMLHRGRIDVMVVGEEVFQGLSQVSGHRFDEDLDLGRAQLAGVGPNAFHMLFTKAHPLGADLHQWVEQALPVMEAQGELKALRRRFRIEP